MAIKTDAELTAQVAAALVVCGTGCITPPVHKAIEDNLISSKLNIKDGGLVVQALTGYTTELTITDNKHFTHKKYVDDAIASGVSGYLPLSAGASFPLTGDLYLDASGIDVVATVGSDVLDIGVVNANVINIGSNATTDISLTTAGIYGLFISPTGIDIGADQDINIVSDSGNVSLNATANISLAYGGTFSFAGPDGFTRNILGTLTGNHDYTLPDATLTFVGTDTVQTLTNKTLTSPVINLGSDADYDMYYRLSGNLTRLAKGAAPDGYVITLVAGVPAWAASAGGVPTQITVADEAADTTCFPAFFTAATGDLGPKTNANLTFDSSTGIMGLLSPSVTTSLTTPSTTFSLVNTTATTVNFAGGASTALNIGHASGVLSFAPTSITLAASTVITASGTVSTTLRNGAANSVVIDITKSAAATANTLAFVGARILGTYSPSTATSTGSFYGAQVGHTINQGASNANPTGGIHVKPILTNVYGTYASVFIETPVPSGGTGTVWGVYQSVSGIDNYFQGQILMGGTTRAASATNTLHIYSGTAPSGNITDGFTLYSADITAGNAAAHFRSENGDIQKIYSIGGWGTPTGTLTRTTYATFAGQTISASPTQTEVQNIDDHVKILSERVAALISDLKTGHQLLKA